jgi:hypothetical protein
MSSAQKASKLRASPATSRSIHAEWIRSIVWMVSFVRRSIGFHTDLRPHQHDFKTCAHADLMLGLKKIWGDMWRWTPSRHQIAVEEEPRVSLTGIGPRKSACVHPSACHPSAESSMSLLQHYDTTRSMAPCFAGASASNATPITHPPKNESHWRFDCSEIDRIEMSTLQFRPPSSRQWLFRIALGCHRPLFVFS